MATIHQTILNFFADRSVNAEEVKFETQEELLEIGFVRVYKYQYGGDNNELDPYFHKYSLDGDVLIAESFGGKYRNAIGTIDDVSNLDLPKWSPIENDEDP